jgi:hypothetical protein
MAVTRGSQKLCSACAPTAADPFSPLPGGWWRLHWSEPPKPLFEAVRAGAKKAAPRPLLRGCDSRRGSQYPGKPGWEDPGLMRQVFLCVLLALALPQAAAAGVIDLVAEPVITGGQALEPAGARATPSRGLDLGLDDVGPRFAQNAPDDREGADPPRAKGDISPYEAQSDRGLSFGFELRPRSRFGDLARKNDTEDPDLGDQLDKLIDRPVFGFRGRYRF